MSCTYTNIYTTFLASINRRKMLQNGFPKIDKIGDQMRNP